MGSRTEQKDFVVVVVVGMANHKGVFWSQIENLAQDFRFTFTSLDTINKKTKHLFVLHFHFKI